jgi:DNA-binding MarR family transcriptional regulator
VFSSSPPSRRSVQRARTGEDARQAFAKSVAIFERLRCAAGFAALRRAATSVILARKDRRATMSGGTARNELRGDAGSGAAPLKLEEFLPYRLNVVASLVSQALSRIYVDRYGIGVAEWRVLVTLGEFDRLTAKAIGAHSHMHKTKVSRAVSELERRKLIARRENSADRRETFLSLTPAGRTIYRDLAPGAIALARHLFETIDPADRAAFERAVTRLTEQSKLLLATNTTPKSDT